MPRLARQFHQLLGEPLELSARSFCVPVGRHPETLITCDRDNADILMTNQQPCP
jgi:hypothetical protein